MIPGLEHVVFWHWWILAGLLLILELTSPAFFFLWVGIAAAIVGFLMLLIPGMPLAAQLALFGVLSIAAVVAWRHYRETHPLASNQPPPNQPGPQHTGRVFTLDHPIVDGVGKVDMDDSPWHVKGPDLPAGTRVRVTDVDGMVLVVEEIV